MKQGPGIGSIDEKKKKNRGRIPPATVSLNEVESTVNCIVVWIKYKF